MGAESVFFVSREWRGRLTVSSMRGFPDEAGVLKYLERVEKETIIRGLPERYGKEGDVTKGWVRVYRLTPDAAPENLTSKFREELLKKGKGA